MDESQAVCAQEGTHTRKPPETLISNKQTTPKTDPHPVRDGDHPPAKGRQELEPPNDREDGEPKQNGIELGDELLLLEVDALCFFLGGGWGWELGMVRM